MRETKEYLKKFDIDPSFQRIKIYQYLQQQKNHPTVNKIYSDLKKEIPTLSKTTIYNNLKLFIDKRLVTVLTIEKNKTRYDANTEAHGHFKCKQCGEIYDFDINIPDYHLENFIIENININCKGICKQCLDNKGKENVN